MEPVGPLPPSVYRRRRAVALATLVLVLGALIWGVASLGGGSEEADPGAAPGEPRPASFSAAEAAARAAARTAASRTADEDAGGDGDDEQPAPTAAAGSDDSAGSVPTSTPSTRGPDPSTTDRSPREAPDPGAALLTPPGAVGRGLLPGSVLGPAIPSTGRSPGPASPGPGPAAPGAAGEPSLSGRAAPASPAPPAVVATCPDSAVRVTAEADKDRYAAGEKPRFSLVVTNTGSVPCRRDLDAARQAMAVVRTPGDGVWGSDDCSPSVTDDVRTLRPGEAVVFSLRWSGTASRPGCPTPRAAVPPGPYQLLTRLDGIVSDPVRFTLAG